MKKKNLTKTVYNKVHQAVYQEQVRRKAIYCTTLTIPTSQDCWKNWCLNQ